MVYFKYKIFQVNYMDYKKLQNGSDIRGVALEGIEGQHVNLTQSVLEINFGVGNGEFNGKPKLSTNCLW